MADEKEFVITDASGHDHVFPVGTKPEDALAAILETNTARNAEGQKRYEASRTKLAAANASPPEKGHDTGPAGSYLGDVADYAGNYTKGVAEGTASLIDPRTYMKTGVAAYEGAKDIPKFVKGLGVSDIGNAAQMALDTAQQTVENPEQLGQVVGTSVVGPEMIPRSVRLLGPAGRKLEAVGRTISPSEAQALGHLSGVPTGGFLPATARVVGRGMQNVAARAGYVPELKGGARTIDAGDAAKIKSVPVEGRPNAGTTRVPYSGQTPAPYRPAAKAAVKAEDAAAEAASAEEDNARKLKEIADAKVGKESTTTARETVSAINKSGGRESATTTFRAPKAKTVPGGDAPIFAGGKWITPENNPSLYESLKKMGVAGDKTVSAAESGGTEIPVGRTASEGAKAPASNTTGMRRMGGFGPDGEPYTPSDLSASASMGRNARQGLTEAGFDLKPGGNIADELVSQEGVTAPRTNVPAGKSARPGVSAGQTPTVVEGETPPAAVSPTARAVADAGEPGVTAPNLRNVPNGRNAIPGAQGGEVVQNAPPPAAPRPPVTRVGGPAPAAPAPAAVAPTAPVAPATAVPAATRLGGTPSGVFAPKPIKAPGSLEALWQKHGAEEAGTLFARQNPGAFGKLPKTARTNLVREAMAKAGTPDAGGLLPEEAQAVIDAKVKTLTTDTAKRAYLLKAPNSAAFNYIYKMLDRAGLAAKFNAGV